MTVDPRQLDDITDRVRAICLALPKAAEKQAWDDATFRVGDRIFAMIKTGDGRISVWCKAPAGSQQVLVGADPETFFVPPYVGHKGWVGMRLDRKPDWTEVERFIIRSYGLIAPRRLAGTLSLFLEGRVAATQPGEVAR